MNTEETMNAVETPATETKPEDQAPVEENSAEEAAVEDSSIQEPAAEDSSIEEPIEEEDEPPAEKNPNFKWYVVHTYSGYENRARMSLMERVRNEALDDYFGDILIPTEDVVDMRDGKKRKTTRKFFPGYMLVEMEMTEEAWHLVKNTQKVTGFVGGTQRKPRPVRPNEVARIMGQMEDGTTKPKTRQTFEEGQQVRVTDGPFMNFTGTVEEVRPDKQKLRVLVSIFGRATPVELDFMQVESA